MAGVISRGVQGPIIREGDDIVDIVVKSVYASEAEDNYSLKNRDIIAVTESVVARAQGNYVTVDQVAKDIAAKFPAKKLGLVFPILSRNRFSMCLKGMARAMDEVVILFSYPNDEVGNPLMERSAYVKNRYSGVYDFEEAAFIDTFGSPVHPFTGVNYLDFYRQVIEAEGAKATFVFSNDCRYIAQFCDQILCCDIHTRNETRVTFYECDITSPIIPPIINSGKAIYINPPTTIPINITGKKITVQSNFRIPQDAFKPNIKNFPTNQIIQIVNNNDNIFFLLLTLIQL